MRKTCPQGVTAWWAMDANVIQQPATPRGTSSTSTRGGNDVLHVGLVVIDESAIVVLKIMQSKKGHEEESAVKPNSAVFALRSRVNLEGWGILGGILGGIVAASQHPLEIVMSRLSFFSRSRSRCVSIAPPAARNRGECTGLALESCHRLCRSTVRHLAFPLRPPPRVIVAALRRGISDILRSSAAGRVDKVSPACSNGSDCETVRRPSPFLPATAQCDPHALFQCYAA